MIDGTLTGIGQLLAMPTQVPTPVSIRASPRNPINRAPPLKPSIVEEASESSSLSSPSSSPEPNVDIDSLKEGLGAQATANGTSHTKSSTEGSSQTKIVESGGTKRAKASLGTDDSKLIPEVPERVRRFVKRSEKLLGVSSDEESYHSPEESHIDPPLTANIVKSAGSFKKTGHTEKDSKKIEVGSEQRIVEDGEPEEDVGRSSKIKGKRKKKVHVKEESVEIERSEEEAEASKKAKQKRKRKVAVEQEVAEGDEGEEVGESPKKTKRRRKTKEEKEAEAMPIAARTPGLTMFIGAHVSCAKGPLFHQTRMYISSIRLN